MPKSVAIEASIARHAAPLKVLSVVVSVGGGDGACDGQWYRAWLPWTVLVESEHNVGCPQRGVGAFSLVWRHWTMEKGRIALPDTGRTGPGECCNEITDPAECAEPL